MFMYIKMIILLFSILLSIAFLTLYERKVLSYIQVRKGPNKTGVKGILQPFSDALKLFSKETTFLKEGNSLVFYSSSFASISIVLILWMVYPSSLGAIESKLGVIFFLCCLTASVYPILGAGWSSNSKFSYIGSLRAISQTISYEVSLSIILLSFVLMANSYNLGEFMRQSPVWLLWLSLPLSAIWFVSSLAETSRTPFDFSEGESELVSGFNTEFSAGSFSLFFLAEYGSILFMSLFFVLVFLGGSTLSIFTFLKTSGLMFLFIWVRGTLPRIRYDKLMALAWKTFLPCSLSYLLFFMGLSGSLLSLAQV